MTENSGNNPIRVLVNGSKGRMGSTTVETLTRDPVFQLVGSCDLEDNLQEQISALKPDVVVDFTVAEVALINGRKIIESGARPVIGTSGLKPNEVAQLQSMAQERGIGGVIAPNFAIGALLLMKFAALAARYLPHCEIIELHHDRKQDAPSGTAIKTAALIAEAREVEHKNPESGHQGIELYPGALGASVQGVPVHSVRLPGLLAHQEVLFGGEGQLLTLRHDSFSRESFMPGVKLACRKAVALDRLVYGLEQLMD